MKENAVDATEYALTAYWRGALETARNGVDMATARLTAHDVQQRQTELMKRMIVHAMVTRQLPHRRGRHRITG